MNMIIGARPEQHTERGVGKIPNPQLPLFDGGVMSTFQGRTNLYNLEIYNSGREATFTDKPEYSGLIEAVTDLYLHIYPDRNTQLAIDRMRKGLSHPRTILMLARKDGIPVGFGLFPRLLISGEPVLYSTRAFTPEHEGEGLGTEVLNRSIEMHQEEVARAHRILRYGVLMTQNPISVRTLEKVPAVEMLLPFHKRYSEDIEARDIMLGVHRLVMINSQSIHTITGVSKAELIEVGINENYRPNREHARVWELYEDMVYPDPHLNMNREQGDVVYVTFRLKRPQEMPTGSLAKAAA